MKAGEVYPLETTKQLGIVGVAIVLAIVFTYFNCPFGFSNYTLYRMSSGEGGQHLVPLVGAIGYNLTLFFYPIYDFGSAPVVDTITFYSHTWFAFIPFLLNFLIAWDLVWFMAILVSYFSGVP